jgi:hypothetical protein
VREVPAGARLRTEGTCSRAEHGAEVTNRGGAQLGRLGPSRGRQTVVNAGHQGSLMDNVFTCSDRVFAQDDQVTGSPGSELRHVRRSYAWGSSSSSSMAAAKSRAEGRGDALVQVRGRVGFEPGYRGSSLLLRHISGKPTPPLIH